MRANERTFVKLYPWYVGFTGDLLFYIAIDTLFLSMVKNFSPSQIVSLDSFSKLICIALQFPILFVIKKIGNTASVRMGAFLLLLSAVFITVGKNYYLVLIGRIFHDVAAIFRSASVVALENNLDLLDKKSDFIRLRTSANTVYSVITMLIAFVASYMFNLNPYLPMIGCITTCTLGFVLSLLMRDCSKYDKIPRSETRGNVKIAWSKFVVLALLAYFVFFPIVNSGQSEGKLFIQQHLLLAFDKEKTALIIGAVVCVSRIVRVLSNVIFSKLYEKYQVGMGMILSVLLCLSIGFITFGSFVTEIAVKIVIMAMGYVIILFVRDPFKLYIQDVVFEHTAKEQHQTLLAVLEFGVKIVGACMGLAFSAILVGYPMVTVMLILYAVSVIEILLCLRLYRIVWVEKKQKSVS